MGGVAEHTLLLREVEWLERSLQQTQRALEGWIEGQQGTNNDTNNEDLMEFLSKCVDFAGLIPNLKLNLVQGYSGEQDVNHNKVTTPVVTSQSGSGQGSSSTLLVIPPPPEEDINVVLKMEVGEPEMESEEDYHHHPYPNLLKSPGSSGVGYFCETCKKPLARSDTMMKHQGRGHSIRTYYEGEHPAHSSKRCRKKGPRVKHEWALHGTFRRVEDAKRSIQGMGYTYLAKRHNMRGVKLYYDCKGGRECPSKVFLDVSDETEEVTMYITQSPHNHEEGVGDSSNFVVTKDDPLALGHDLNEANEHYEVEDFKFTPIIVKKEEI